ncbi:protein kinase domain-containing protein [Streptomyces sp. DSM 40750]|uniref:serine/threonine-protein kinase n=1 Tax=Streptomyces sp. DSM 40750 TaxID=2801030 RepID=UPI00214B5A9A|nr:serine/threonine-protein kinase [Streptomyces sp. DSM 40750]UUU26183.1 serine/threonine-protein kinase [Streptomyces sp. DSM 40750]
MPLRDDDPTVIGGYVLESRLGAGGMGVVYLARSVSGRLVAIKLVHAQYCDDEEFRSRFRQEVAAARRVSGAFTTPVVDADPEAARPWMATLYVPGPTLSDLVCEEGPLGGARIRGLALGLVEALRDIHRAGVVHRDLKPANVLIAEDGPRVIDFGISRAVDNLPLTVTGRVIGTPPFMSPEQLRSPRDVTPASDVFSLGSLLVYAASGHSPFKAESPYLAGYQVMFEAPKLDTVPEPLRSIAERCLDKDPAARPDLAELHRLFLELPTSTDARPAATDPEPVAPTTYGRGEGRRAKRQLLLVGLGAALTVGALSAALLLYPGDKDTSKSSDTAAGYRSVSLPKGWQPWRTPLRNDDGFPAEYVATGYKQPGCLTDGTDLYCGGTGFVVAEVDAATGKMGWRHGTLPQTSRPIGVRDGLAYVYGEPDTTRRRLIALDTATGKERWARFISASEAVYLYDGGLLTLTPDHLEVVAYSTAGDELWRSPVPGAVNCVPRALGDDPYALCWEGDDFLDTRPFTLVRLDPDDGTRQELAPLPKKSLALGTVDGQPLFLGAETTEEVYEPGYERPYNAFLRVDPETGEITRIPLKRALRGSATLVDGVVYFVRTNGWVAAVSATSGKELWERTTDMENLSAPAVSKARDEVYFANRFGRLLALDGGTGAELWRTEALDDPGDIAAEARPSVVLVEDAIVATAGDTALSVSPDEPMVRPSASAAGD